MQQEKNQTTKSKKMEKHFLGVSLCKCYSYFHGDWNHYAVKRVDFAFFDDACQQLSYIRHMAMREMLWSSGTV